MGRIVGSRLLLLVSCPKNAGKKPQSLFRHSRAAGILDYSRRTEMKINAGFRRHDDIRIL